MTHWLGGLGMSAKSTEEVVAREERWQPVAQRERYPVLDVIRGVALFGVLLVNTETLFRVSLFRHMLQLHTEAGWMNHLVDVLLAGAFEFKAFSLFSLMFGVGFAIQAERAAE